MNAFNKSHRLLTKIDYDRVFNKAKKIVTKHFIILHSENYIGHARLGIAITKKVIHKAHDRNRIKRILRESFRTNKLKATDIIFLAKKGLNKLDNSDLANELQQTWGKL